MSDVLTSQPNSHIGETWIQANWRPVAAFVYFFICMMDFMVMPFLTFLWHEPLSHILTQINGFSPDIQKEILAKTTIFWSPITIAGAGIIHMAFGAILGVSAWGRSSERVELVKQNATTQRILFGQKPPSGDVDNLQVNIIKDRQ